MLFLPGAQFHNLLFYIIGLSGTGGGEAIPEGGAEREVEYSLHVHFESCV